MILHPAITINGITYTGDHLDGKELEGAICEAYRQAPDECVMAYLIVDPKNGIVEEKLTMPNDPDLLYQEGIKDSKMNWINGEKVRRTHVIALIIIIVAINLIVLAVVRCRMKRQMSQQLSSQV